MGTRRKAIPVYTSTSLMLCTKRFGLNIFHAVSMNVAMYAMIAGRTAPMAMAMATHTARKYQTFQIFCSWSLASMRRMMVPIVTPTARNMKLVPPVVSGLGPPMVSLYSTVVSPVTSSVWVVMSAASSASPLICARRKKRMMSTVGVSGCFMLLACLLGVIKARFKFLYIIIY